MGIYPVSAAVNAFVYLSAGLQLCIKVEEIKPPSAANFLYCADSSYSETEIPQAKHYFLKPMD